MKKGEIKTVDQVWDLINQGKTVYCSSDAYKIYIEDNLKESPYYNSPSRQFSTKGERLLSARCISNYFGSVLHESDLNQLFTKE